jgi:arylsulfatase A
MRGAIFVLGSLLLLSSCSREPARSALPNVVLVLADDLGLGDLGCYQPESRVPTPHLDAIAAAGLRFSDAHSPSSVCTPTRYGLLTGRYAWRTRLESGVLWGDSRLLLDPERTTLADLFQRAGYATGGFGKWHLGFGVVEPVDYSAPLVPGPLELGFDEYFGIPASLDMHPYVYVRDRGVEAQPTEATPGSSSRRSGGGGFWRAGPEAPGFDQAEVLDRITEEALSFLAARAAEPGRPFFLYLPLSAPHTPWLPSSEFRGRSGAGYYGDFVTQVDACIGRLDAALEELGLTEDTLLIVTSDNGAHWTESDIAEFEHRANGDVRGQKADIWEGGHRVPLLVRWPGRVVAGSTSDQLACLTDLFATCSGILGRELRDDEGEDSFDLAPALFGTPGITPQRTSVVHHSLRGHFAIREGALKLIPQHGSGGFTSPAERAPREGEPPGSLYDLGTDPTETTNLWESRSARVAELTALLKQIRSSGRSRPSTP